MARASGLAEGQVTFKAGKKDRNFIVRVTTERSEDAEHGHVVTFDDITELVSAQRNSAWADIARRIAHEIKNPLTPIQLSAERLRRKYGREIQTDKQVFEQCTDTIIRQVGDIGRMVDEFSSFARMPSAVLELQDLISVVKEATVLQRVSSADVAIDVDTPETPVMFPFDRRLVTQAVTNLVKNAREAIEARQSTQPEPQGRILVEAAVENDTPFIRVTDNGVGLPKENRHRLTEPYMTTREKGTGLGLAIVKRIMEEHKGRLVLEDSPDEFAGGLGARITLYFEPISTTQLAATA
jgi:two-component system nitrogen regulation sensor histidine kinase NtrY